MRLITANAILGADDLAVIIRYRGN